MVISAVATVDFKASLPRSTIQIVEFATTACGSDSSIQEESEILTTHSLHCSSWPEYCNGTALLVLCVVPHSSTGVESILKNILIEALDNDFVNDGISPLLFNIVELLPMKWHLHSLDKTSFLPISSTPAAASASKEKEGASARRRLFTPVTASSETTFTSISLFESFDQMFQRSDQHNVSSKVSDPIESVKTLRRRRWRERSLQVKLKWAHGGSEDDVLPRAQSHERGMDDVCTTLYMTVCMYVCNGGMHASMCSMHTCAIEV